MYQLLGALKPQHPFKMAEKVLVPENYTFLLLT